MFNFENLSGELEPGNTLFLLWAGMIIVAVPQTSTDKNPTINLRGLLYIVLNVYFA
jgi:hypothetical protein